MIRYTDSLDGIGPDMLEGFFVGWRTPRTPTEHLTILRDSGRFLLAIDDRAGRVVGFVTVLTDGLQAAFIPLLEVLPDMQGQGIGSELMRRIIQSLNDVACVDLTCDAEVQPFYERLGMQRSVGMVLRRDRLERETNPSEAKGGGHSDETRRL